MSLLFTMKRLIVTDYSLFCLILNSPFPSLMTKCFDLLNCILQIDSITSSKHIPYFSSSWQRTVHAWSAVCLTIYYVSGYSCHIHTYSQTTALTIQALLNFIDYYLNNLYFSFLAHRKYWERTDRKKLKIWRTIGADVWQNAIWHMAWLRFGMLLYVSTSHWRIYAIYSNTVGFFNVSVP